MRTKLDRFDAWLAAACEWVLRIIAVLSLILLVAGIAAAVIFGTRAALAQTTFPCYVERIVDGDTWDCTGGTRIRAAYSDAPENGQQGGEFARRTLDSLLECNPTPDSTKAPQRASKQATGRCRNVTVLICTGTRRHRDRLVAHCWLPDGRDLDALMIRAGAAWDYTAYSNGRYLGLQEMARADRVGIWAEPNPTPPWQWRAQQRAKR